MGDGLRVVGRLEEVLDGGGAVVRTAQHSLLYVWPYLEFQERHPG